VVYNVTSINKTNNHLSPQLTEHQVKTITFDVGNPGPGLGQTRTCCRINIYMQPVTYIYAMMKRFHPHVPQNPQTTDTNCNNFPKSFRWLQDKHMQSKYCSSEHWVHIIKLHGENIRKLNIHG
jgi:hypothetical protein